MTPMDTDEGEDRVILSGAKDLAPPRASSGDRKGQILRCAQDDGASLLPPSDPYSSVTSVSSVATPLLSLPSVPIDVRVATLADLPLIDALQKKQSRAVGWMPTKQIEGKIEKGEVLIAEERHEGTEARRHEGEDAPSALHSVPACLRASVPSPLGYLIGCDRYFKRDDVGIIYAINVVPEYQRHLVAATLLKAQFERPISSSLPLLSAFIRVHPRPFISPRAWRWRPSSAGRTGR
jgi:hypothetical protein